MLEAEHISYRFADTQPWIIQNATLRIAPGEVVGLHGHSGEGKTTLAKILAGYLMPDKGTVRVDQAPLPSKGYCPVQMVFQHPETVLNPRWCIRDSLLEAGTVPDERLRHFQLKKEWLERKPHELSGGELQRIAIARVLGTGTRYLLADEITTMLDAITQVQIWTALLAVAKKKNIGAMVISHDAQLIKRICDRVINIAGIQWKGGDTTL
ncbi:ABC transporter ATP-binding protein [Desulfosarcina ovata]|uniref:Peptide ABC transporter n=1 Tax=Desulfosarcina ovata subsp. ovata TaxID=2752305 RepID=A0A5K8AAH4_9BACT|nr:ATP-binding cassette domain-containing protein [Desulfosarcina ovata]BBO89587.1 peptide ABC transporter [Desulfosarcina ovata subsp. ovata]